MLGIRPTRAETGYGYIEAGSPFQGDALRVRRFTEKPDAARAAEFVSAGNYYWNSGMFLWSARTLTNALREHLPETAAMLAADRGDIRHAANLPPHLPGSIRSAKTSASTMLCSSPARPRENKIPNIICLPADFGWNDLGSWTALHEHHSAKSSPQDGNLVNGKGLFALQRPGKLHSAPGKFVAALGVNNLVVVETEDALLITTRERAQDVGKMVKYLDEKKLNNLV